MSFPATARSQVAAGGASSRDGLRVTDRWSGAAVSPALARSITFLSISPMGRMASHREFAVAATLISGIV